MFLNPHPNRIGNYFAWCISSSVVCILIPQRIGSYSRPRHIVIVVVVPCRGCLCLPAESRALSLRVLPPVDTRALPDKTFLASEDEVNLTEAGESEITWHEAL